MTKRKKRKQEIHWWHPIVIVIAAVLGFTKGLTDGFPPPPGNRRG